MLLILLSGGAPPPPPLTGSQNTWAQGAWGDVPWAGSQPSQGGAFSLGLDAGSYALTGQNVGLTWSGETPVKITDRIVTLRSLTERWRM